MYQTIKNKVTKSKRAIEIMKEFNVSFDDLKVYDVSKGEVIQVGTSDIEINYFDDNKIHIVAPL